MTEICSMDEDFSLSRLSFQERRFRPVRQHCSQVARLDCVVAVCGNGGVVGEGRLSSAWWGGGSSGKMCQGNVSSAYGTPQSLMLSQRVFGLTCKLPFTRESQMLGFLSGERRKSALKACAQMKGRQGLAEGIHFANTAVRARPCADGQM